MQRQVRVSNNNTNINLNRKNENIPVWINECFTFRYFTEAILVILNLVLLLKTSSYFVAYLNNSSRLIADYDGALLLNEGFKFYFILMNCLLFISSSLCLLTLLFVSSQKIKVKFIKYYALIQSLAAFLTVLLMAKLWFSPFKLELDERSWLNDIKTYTYNSELQLSNFKDILHQQQNQLIFPTTPNIILSSSASLPTSPENDLNFEFNNDNSNMKRYNYVDLVDKLQYALGCCGILGPDDWRQENQLLGLLAPSCCLRPTHLQISMPIHSIGGNTILLGNSTTIITEPAATITGATRRQLARNFISISYCKIELSNTIGCQNLLSNRQIQFTFNLRMSLLFLLSILIILIMAALNFYAPSHLSPDLSPPSQATSPNHRATVSTAQPSQQFYLIDRSSSSPSSSSSSSSSSPPSRPCPDTNVREQQPVSDNLLTKVPAFQQAGANDHRSHQRNNEHSNLQFTIDHSKDISPVNGGCMFQINRNQQQHVVIDHDYTNNHSANSNCDTVLTIS